MILLTAITLDALLGEPKRWHPLVGFGRLATRVERLLYASHRLAGLLALLLVVSPFVLLAYWLQTYTHGPFATAVLLYIAIGWKSLVRHAQPIATSLMADNIDKARRKLSRIVSRDTDGIHEEGIARATVETVLENGCDAIFGAIFWALVAGAPGVVLYRLVNTLDAMWGYKNERYLHFGWAAARLDDLLNFIPARLTAVSYCLLGNAARGWRCWQQQGTGWKSPNAGPVMASGAGSLGLLLGGSAQYHGKQQFRPILGEGRAPGANDITRALHLVNRTVVLWVFSLLLPALILSLN